LRDDRTRRGRRRRRTDRDDAGGRVETRRHRRRGRGTTRNRELDGSRAGGLYARTLEVFDQRGIVDRFLNEGQALQVQGFAYIPLDISDFATRYNYGLALWQSHIERIMAGRIGSAGIRSR
jgi:hypothetical protein